MKYTIPEIITFAKITFGDMGRTISDAKYKNVRLYIKVDKPIEKCVLIWHGDIKDRFKSYERIYQLEQEIGQEITVKCDEEC